MYTREILAPIASPIEDGKPLFGTYDKAFKKVDLIEIKKPYRYPLPRWLKNYRIKEWQSFIIFDEHIMLHAVFCDLKLYRVAEITVFNKDSGEKNSYRKFEPVTGWTLPQTLANSTTESNSEGFFFRIHNCLDANTVQLDINIEAGWRRPPLTACLLFNLDDQAVTPMAVSLSFTKRRSMYAFKAFSPVHGYINSSGNHIDMQCSGFFCDYKGYFPVNMHSIITSATGFNDQIGRFGFHIAENQTRENNKNNENALWVDGKLTPLPPVLITMPNGPDSAWVIQDVEGMIDLTFTPKELNKNRFNAIITKADFIAPLGYYNGMLMDSEARQIQIKNLFGLGEKIDLRV